jgi:hypothetical protein
VVVVVEMVVVVVAVVVVEMVVVVGASAAASATSTIFPRHVPIFSCGVPAAPSPNGKASRACVIPADAHFQPGRMQEGPVFKCFAVA